MAWNDLVKGPISVGNAELDDLVIARGDGVPTYNFAVVVDDIDMRITHVLRGDDHVNNTPRQINIYRALLGRAPRCRGSRHLPMILGPDGQKLSKRHGAVSVLQYDDDGFLPEALFNYLARLGWSHGDAEQFTRAQLVQWFDLEHVNRAPAQYDIDKLLWLNGEYLKQADDARLAALVGPRLRAARRRGRHGRPGRHRGALQGAGEDAQRAGRRGPQLPCGSAGAAGAAGRAPNRPGARGAGRVPGAGRRPAGLAACRARRADQADCWPRIP